jgi:hypothetical protein
MNPIRKFLFLVAATTALATSSTTAAILTVTSLADNGPGTLRNQIAASGPGDIIQFAVNGTITLGSAITINQSVAVQGPGASKLIVSGNFVDRVFVVTGHQVVLSGMTIRDGLIAGTAGVDGGTCENGTNGGDAVGGGMFATALNPLTDYLVLSNCWFTGNIARAGAGGRGGDNPIGAACTPGKGGSGGNADGGALAIFVPTSTIINCTFSDNRALGGLGGDGGDNLNSAANIAAGKGGQGGGAHCAGINVMAPGQRNLTNCTISGNIAIGGHGGAGGNNSAAFTGGDGGDGGGSFCAAIEALQTTIISCTIVSNTALDRPGGSGGSGVPAGANGSIGIGYCGGLCAYANGICGGPTQIGNTIVADNFASTVYFNLHLEPTELGFNYFGDDDWMLCASATSRIGTVLSRLHPLLGPLTQNGSGIPTHAPLPGSPVIDWGYSFGFAKDARGAPRPVGTPVNSGDGSDIGAFEFGSTPLGMFVQGDGADQKLMLTWPSHYGDFRLQSTTNLLSASSWVDATNAPVVSGNQFVITNNMTDSARYYRLKAY